MHRQALHNPTSLRQYPVTYIICDRITLRYFFTCSMLKSHQQNIVYPKYIKKIISVLDRLQYAKPILFGSIQKVGIIVTKCNENENRLLLKVCRYIHWCILFTLIQRDKNKNNSESNCEFYWINWLCDYYYNCTIKYAPRTKINRMNFSN